MREAARPALLPLSRFPLPFPMTDGVMLAFDFGVHRIGVAIGNSVTHKARPLTTVDTAGSVGPWAAIGKLIADWQPERLVVGVPFHPDGTPHETTARCERFARQLEGRFRLPVERVDERYSSAAATGAVDVDAAAAALILQQWIDESEAKGRNA